MKTKILVLGATGKVGSEVFRLLSQNPDVTPIAAARSEAKASEMLGDGAQVRVLDLDDQATFASALNGIDSALLVTGYTVDMLKQSKAFLDEAKIQTVKHIVHIGASGSPTNEVAHWGWHQMVEAYIEKLGFSWTHLRPEAFMQNVVGPGFSWLNGDVVGHFIGDATWTWVDCLDVAAVSAVVLADSHKYAGQIIRLGYDSASMDEVAERLTEESGRQISAEAGDPDDFLKAAIEAGADPAYISCIHRQFQLDAAGLIPGAGDTYGGFEEIVGRHPTTWATFAKREKESI